ncbi:NAD-dependent epimerase/dehydratase family protein [Parasediminibacterium paludis]|uniref:NAD-dependent epimerase/dehydratase family protein n=1 Tax=Parasediminibacterium paludis TaxID=908966 RepID=A0ABV8Q2L1_9BACT
MRILITGATGFVGRNLVPALASNHELYLLVRDLSKTIQYFSDKVACIVLDENWKAAVKASNPEIVIHLASYLTSSDDALVIDNLLDSNIVFGTHLLNALSSTNLQYFINTGTFAEYLSNNPSAPEPAYLYAASKTAFRSILQYYQAIIGFKTINVIPYTIYGGKDSQRKLMDIIYDSLDAKQTTQMSPGDQMLDFIHVDDVVNFYMHLIDCISVFKNNYSEIHLGTGIGSSPRMVAKLLEDLTGSVANINWGGIAYRKRDTMHSVVIANQASDYFEWQPQISLKAGIKIYLDQKQ